MKKEREKVEEEGEGREWGEREGKELWVSGGGKRGQTIFDSMGNKMKDSAKFQ